MSGWGHGRKRTSKCIQAVTECASSGYLATLLFRAQLRQEWDVRPHFDNDTEPENDLKSIESKLRVGTPLSA